MLTIHIGIKRLKIDFDPKKDILNIKNHGVSLKDAENIEWDTLVTYEDVRYTYGEQRMIGLAYIGLRLYYMVFTEVEEDQWRVISLRRATKREIKHYANT